MENNNVEQKTVVEPVNNQNNNKLAPFIILLVVLVLGLGGYIVYDKVLKKDSTPSPTPVNNPTSTPESTPKEQDSSLPEWANYILNQNITEINYNYPSYDENGDNLQCLKKEISKDQLKMILEKMTQSTLTKEYIGGAGSECNDEGIAITYGSGKQLVINHGYMIWEESTEKDVINLLEKDVDTTEKLYDGDASIVYTFGWDSNNVDQLLGIK